MYHNMSMQTQERSTSPLYDSVNASLSEEESAESGSVRMDMGRVIYVNQDAIDSTASSSLGEFTVVILVRIPTMVV